MGLSRYIFHTHIVINQQMNVFQVGTGKLILGNLADAAIFGVDTEQFFQDSTDLRFAFAAVTLDNHHALGFVGGQQKIADELLEHGDVPRGKVVHQEKRSTLLA